MFINYDGTYLITYHLKDNRYYRLTYPSNWDIVQIAFDVSNSYRFSDLISYSFVLIDNSLLNFIDYASVELIEEKLYLVIKIP